MSWGSTQRQQTMVILPTVMACGHRIALWFDRTREVMNQSSGFEALVFINISL